MLHQLVKKWEEKGLVFLVVCSLVFLCIYAFTRIGKPGTYSEYTYIPFWSSKRRIKRQPKQKQKDSTGETLCRQYLEKRFGKPFSKIRPDFLRNNVTGGYNLELDCYNHDLRLAVEYNGIQHYKYVPYFHKNKEAFTNQKYRDEMKRERCKQYGIHLIEVPYTIKPELIALFLEDKIDKL